MNSTSHRLIYYEDLPMLLAHRNEEDTRKYLEYGDEITMSQHYRWWYTIVRPDINLYRIATSDGEAIGLIRVTDLNRTDGTACVGCDVFSQWRGCGLGHLVFEAACELARNKGAMKEHYLWVFQDNLRAVRIYEKAGFKKTDTEKEVRGRPYTQYRKPLSQ